MNNNRIINVGEFKGRNVRGVVCFSVGRSNSNISVLLDRNNRNLPTARCLYAGKNNTFCGKRAF